MESTGEVKRLQSCINDLISVLALPAIWSGREPSQILGTLLDVLLIPKGVGCRGTREAATREGFRGCFGVN